MTSGELLAVENVTKYFPGVVALDRVNFKLNSGEVHALVGENGAGKSTFINIAAGVLQPDGGSIFISGMETKISSPFTAKETGISTVYQELSLAESLTVAENVIHYKIPLIHGKFYRWNTIFSQCSALLRLFNKEYISPKTAVKDLSITDKQIVEILKAVSVNPRILILDEPTSSLGEAEVNKLFELINELKGRGTSVIYITHHLKEVFRIADRVTVFRDGRYVSTDTVDSVTEDELITKMIGREIKPERDTDCPAGSDQVFRARNLGSEVIKNINFSVNRGEILGMYGLVGAGRTELAKVIFGIDPADEGEMFLNNKLIKNHSPLQAIHNKIGYISEDRKGSGLFLEKSLRDNIISPQLYKYQKGGFMDEKRATAAAEKYAGLTKAKYYSLKQLTTTLSGGNQQKVLLAAWFQTEPALLIIDEPTKGVDVGARGEIYQIIRDMALRGMAIVLITSDLTECLTMSNRILVFREKKIIKELDRKDATEELIVSYAAGVRV
jgi:ABC-type sugar transport system ATPase subunit